MAQTKITQYETTDWTDLSAAPNTVTANGNRSYSLVFNSVDYTGLVQPGTRIRTTRTVAAPNQSASLNGTNQYFSKSSPAGMTFTDDFTVSAWVKLNNYPTGGTNGATIVSRYNGTSGWVLRITTSGQVLLAGVNGGSNNASYVQSYQSIPLNKWVHISTQLDMSAFTATTTTSYVMIDGVDVPAFVQRGGTNPTALVQAGNLEIGAENSGTANSFFPGKIAQVAIFNAKVTQATIQGYISQGLAGTETSLISAFSLSNSVNDLNTTNANNLTAQNSAATTNADAPFGGQANGTISTTLDYGIVQTATFSTNTTVVVQVPEGNTIPTSGGVTTVSYSGLKAPYGLPSNINKWFVESIIIADQSQSNPAQNTWYNVGGHQLTVPIGGWAATYDVFQQAQHAGTAYLNTNATLGTTSSSSLGNIYQTRSAFISVSAVEANAQLTRTNLPINITSATVYYLNAMTTNASVTLIKTLGSVHTGRLQALPANL